MNDFEILLSNVIDNDIDAMIERDHLETKIDATQYWFDEPQMDFFEEEINGNY